ncbi:lipooligosaccharide transport system ATP-binding protein [Allocatelliglobosispora scoriae]|uniref:Lipooligosaccharide transport system ATP-binding protein n=1 Tax=Allocatelliglobosispora scoriae TaxID=643052 RepID=A0A841BGX8_9ACTN|nr:ABC transporter ATP-binding protein [Allocatelliglobosispora scoriae]MBB5868337.1 lipooligosaccharide transport system ATP-binding protein [Allocatelliglobosispora scoriae]
MSQERPLVSASGLVKRYGDFTAVDGIDFEVHPGEVFGLLGPNGAGKSSTMRMISCVSKPSAGELRMFGMDAATDGPRIRSRIGVCPQQDTLDPELSLEQNLTVFARYFGIPKAVARTRAAELLGFVQLQDRAAAKVDSLSGGMKRRLSIARAMINDPGLLLLDEPTTGLDPQARHLLWERLDQLRRRGVTLVLTTHYMDEAEQLCDRLVIVDHGRIVAAGTPGALIAGHCTKEVLELRFAGDTSGVAASLTGIGVRTETLPDRVLVYADDGDAAATAVHTRGIGARSALVRRAGLEDVFLHLTGRSLGDE